MSEWWQSVRTMVAVVTAEYIHSEYRTEAFGLEQYLRPIRGSPTPPTLSTTEQRVRLLVESVDTDPILRSLTEVEIATDSSAYVDAFLAIAATVIDLRSQTARPSYADVLSDLSTVVTRLKDGDPVDEHLSRAADRTVDQLRLVLTALETLEALQTVSFSHEDDDVESVRKCLSAAVEAGNLSDVLELHQSVVVGRWRRYHFSRFDPRAFEHLVAKLYRTHGYEVTVREKGPDGGIDVVATRDGTTKLIQVKHQSSSVDAPTFDKYVALLQYYDPDEVVLATSSTFTDPALTRWRRVADRVRPLDGKMLLRRLTESPLAPPLQSD